VATATTAAASALRIGIPVYQGVDLLDVAGPLEMFSWASIAVDLLAETPGLITSRAGMAFQVDKGFGDAVPYDALWVPGGDPAALLGMMKDPKRTYLNFLIDQAAKTKMTCSVCEGALLLADAGLLDGYLATTHWAFIACLKRYPKVKVVEGYPRYQLDRDRLTGGGISSGLDESLRLIELLLGTEAAQGVQLSTQYYPCPPVGSAIPGSTACPLDDVQL
jgi:transcriptional regulator GlxA family with amidase domain